MKRLDIRKAGTLSIIIEKGVDIIKRSILKDDIEEPISEGNNDTAKDILIILLRYSKRLKLYESLKP
jgi:hypothetical protein